MSPDYQVPRGKRFDEFKSREQCSSYQEWAEQYRDCLCSPLREPLEDFDIDIGLLAAVTDPMYRAINGGSLEGSVPEAGLDHPEIPIEELCPRGLSAALNDI